MQIGLSGSCRLLLNTRFKYYSGHECDWLNFSFKEKKYILNIKCSFNVICMNDIKIDNDYDAHDLSQVSLVQHDIDRDFIVASIWV